MGAGQSGETGADGTAEAAPAQPGLENEVIPTPDQALSSLPQKLLEKKEKELMDSIMINYGRIKDVERELAQVQMQLKLTAGPKKAALEHLRQKIEVQGDKVSAVRARYIAAKQLADKLAAELAAEEAAKDELCKELNMLVQESATAQLAKLEQLKSQLEHLMMPHGSTAGGTAVLQPLLAHAEASAMAAAQLGLLTPGAGGASSNGTHPAQLTQPPQQHSDASNPCLQQQQQQPGPQGSSAAAQQQQGQRAAEEQAAAAAAAAVAAAEEERRRQEAEAARSRHISLPGHSAPPSTSLPSDHNNSAYTSGSTAPSVNTAGVAAAPARARRQQQQQPQQQAAGNGVSASTSGGDDISSGGVGGGGGNGMPSPGSTRHTRPVGTAAAAGTGRVSSSGRGGGGHDGLPGSSQQQQQQARAVTAAPVAATATSGGRFAGFDM